MTGAVHWETHSQSETIDVLTWISVYSTRVKSHAQRTLISNYLRNISHRIIIVKRVKKIERLGFLQYYRKLRNLHFDCYVALNSCDQTEPHGILNFPPNDLQTM